MKELRNLAHFKRYLLKEKNLLVVRGEIGPVMAGMQVYNSRHRISPHQPERVPTAQDLLLSISLAAFSLSDRESWGVSVTFSKHDHGFFVGVEPEGMMCIRTREAKRNQALAVFQRQKSNGPLIQSTIVPASDDSSELIEHYFEQAVQTATRVAVMGDQGVLVQAFPGGDFAAVSALSGSELFHFVDRAFEGTKRKDIGEVVAFYECRCSEERILETIHRLDVPKREELWGDEASLEVECPRCGRKVQIRKNKRSGA